VSESPPAARSGLRAASFPPATTAHAPHSRHGRRRLDVPPGSAPRLRPPGSGPRLRSPAPYPGSDDAHVNVHLKRDLRPETRKRAEKKAEAAHERPMKRLATGEKKNKRHMAQEASVFGLCAEPRTAADVPGGQEPANETETRPRVYLNPTWVTPPRDLPSQPQLLSALGGARGTSACRAKFARRSLRPGRRPILLEYASRVGRQLERVSVMPRRLWVRPQQGTCVWCQAPVRSEWYSSGRQRAARKAVERASIVGRFVPFIGHGGENSR
jgi:hypothetical protein